MKAFVSTIDIPPHTNWGHLLLAIRKDLGNKRTKLKEKDMLSSQITDIDQLVPE